MQHKMFKYFNQLNLILGRCDTKMKLNFAPLKLVLDFHWLAFLKILDRHPPLKNIRIGKRETAPLMDQSSVISHHLSGSWFEE